jgi:hypothetical protein
MLTILLRAPSGQTVVVLVLLENTYITLRRKIKETQRYFLLIRPSSGVQ